MSHHTNATTSDVLMLVGIGVAYVVFTGVSIYQWYHPDVVSYKSFLLSGKSTQHTPADHERHVRSRTVVSLLVMNTIVAFWLITRVRR